MSAGGVSIAVVGTMDTKGHEHRFVCEVIAQEGGRPLVVDCGILGEPRGIVPDITREDVALAAGSTLEAVRALGARGPAVETMLAGLRNVLRQRHAAGQVDGVIALGGAEGTVLGTAAMQSLPLGVPKLMVSAIASGPRAFGPFVGTSDVTIMHSVVDAAGFNEVSRAVYANAAAGVVAMARRHRDHGYRREGPSAGVSMLGNTQAAVDLLAPRLERAGIEPVAFHANGVGGAAMERLAREGRLDAVVELAVNEVTNELMGGVTRSTEPDRMVTAGRLGLPQVFVPACADFFTFGPLDDVPARFRDRPLYRHNPHFTLVRASAGEMARFGAEFARRLNETRGPLVVVWPEGGLSLSNQPGGEFWDPEADAAFVTALERDLTVAHELVRVPAHVNQPAVADVIAEAIGAHVKTPSHI